nr:MAG TPA: hypothetical protein [Caudoviricetes sp.]
MLFYFGIYLFCFFFYTPFFVSLSLHYSLLPEGESNGTVRQRQNKLS